MMKMGIAVTVLAVAVVACDKKAEPPGTGASASASASAKAPMASASATVDPPFEGEIVMTIKDQSGKKLPASITYDVKGDKVRYAPVAVNLHAVSDMAAQHAYAIDDNQKTYRDVDTKIMADAGKAVAAEAKVTKTGKIEKIAGMDCENWTIEGGDEKVDVCAAKGIAYFDFAADPKPGATEPPWAASLTKEKVFPLRVTVHDKAGKEQFRAEAQAVVRKKLDDSLFQLPAGFKKAELDVKWASLP
jgi:Domain of unknown function (DUF4412)